MNERLEALAAQRRYLVERSALHRLRLRRDLFAVRGAVGWKRVPTARAGRILLFASRAILVAKLARIAIGYARGRTT